MSKFTVTAWSASVFPLVFSKTTSANFSGFVNVAHGFIANGSALMACGNEDAGPIVTPTLTNSTEYRLFLAMRASGAQYFSDTGSGGYPLLRYIRSDNSTSPLYAAWCNNNAIFTHDDLRVRSSFLASPLVSDGFGTSFGTSDGLGHAETSGTGSGGSGIIWTQGAGTWTVSGGKLRASVLSGGIAIATSASSTTDQFIGLDITRIAGDIGIVLRYTDANNYVRTTHNGTNLQVIKRVAGVDTTVINAAATYSAGKRIWIWTNGTAFRAYFNDASIGSATISDSVLQSGVIGVYTSDLGNTGDNLVSYAVGTGGEYVNAFSILATGSATSDGTSTQTATGTRKRTGSATSDGVTTQTATGTRKRTGSATSDGVTTQTATGARKRTGTATSDGTGTASASSRVNSRGTGRSDGAGAAAAGGARRQLTSARGTGTSTAVIHNHTTSGAIYSS